MSSFNRQSSEHLTNSSLHIFHILSLQSLAATEVVHKQNLNMLEKTILKILWRDCTWHRIWLSKYYLYALWLLILFCDLSSWETTSSSSVSNYSPVSILLLCVLQIIVFQQFPSRICNSNPFITIYFQSHWNKIYQSSLQWTLIPTLHLDLVWFSTPSISVSSELETSWKISGLALFEN